MDCEFIIKELFCAKAYYTINYQDTINLFSPLILQYLDNFNRCNTVID